MGAPAIVLDLGTANARNPAFSIAAPEVPWVPIGAGRAIKPLRFFPEHRGYVGVLRVNAGAVVPLHRHTGDVHAFNLDGWRELDTGELVGPGGYVYEPRGNTDTWRTVGEEPAIVLVVVRGAVEHLDDTGAVTHRHDAAHLQKLYRQHCAEHGIAANVLLE
jgi:2,4'-dihydroxyacetophenone dioxygenase